MVHDRPCLLELAVVLFRHLAMIRSKAELQLLDVEGKTLSATETSLLVTMCHSIAIPTQRGQLQPVWRSGKPVCRFPSVWGLCFMTEP